MSVRIVTDLCKQQSQNAMLIVLEGDNREELVSLEARNAAITAARQFGFPARGISSIPHPYPVNEKGEIITDLKEPVKGCRAEYVVSTGLGM